MSEDGATHQVLARKYRPADFAGLIGQDVLVRTLANAIRMDRLAHAYLLTGVRGVGKTTTARIIARALNCIGATGDGGPTPEPCGVCEHCLAISEDRHVDVIEMDAASRTGVDDVRELIESVRYRPVSARYKVYIIDEVHMLSKQAFNALLKTLEEPPPRVKFVFATTEARKLPVTVLSRCQRFDLRRVEMETLAAHFGRIAELEKVEATPAALALIARAADGSVRDGLSLLDRAMAHTGSRIEEAAVRDMLGLADRTQVLDLFDMLMRGAVKDALDCFAALHDAGAEPAVLLQDLLELSHWLTRLKLAPSASDDPTVPEAEATRGRTMAEALSIPVLTRVWQMLLKGLEETGRATRPAMAAEMTLVRIAYAADLPTPAEAIRALETGAAKSPPAPSPPENPQGTTSLFGNGPRAATQPDQAPSPQGAADAPAPTASMQAAAPALRADVETETGSAPAPQPPSPASFSEIVALAEARREPRLSTWLRRTVRPRRVSPGVLDIDCGDPPDSDMVTLLRDRLEEWTGARWIIALTDAPDAPTLEELARDSAKAADEKAIAHPLVQQVLETFPGARVRAVHRTRVEQPSEGDPTK